MNPVQLVIQLTAALQAANAMIKAAKEVCDEVKLAYEATKDDREKLAKDIDELKASLDKIASTVLPTVLPALINVKDTLGDAIEKLSGHRFFMQPPAIPGETTETTPA